MAAQATLTRLVMVRIHVGQPFGAPSQHGLLMAGGRQGSESSGQLRPLRGEWPRASAARRGAGWLPRIMAGRLLGADPCSVIITPVNPLIAEARRVALSKGQRPASKGTCVVYFLRLRSGTLYIGASEDIEQRLEDHTDGQACRTTHRDPPGSFLRMEIYAAFSEARTREAQLKRWSRAKKEALIQGDLECLHALSKSRELLCR